jgi:hypothetical protein
MNEFNIEGTINRFETFTTKNGKEIITMILSVEGKWEQLVPIKLFGALADSWKNRGRGHVVLVTGKLGGRDWNGKVYGENVAMDVKLIEAAKATAIPVGADDNIPFDFAS